MAHFKVLLDQSLTHLAKHFPSKRVATFESLGLPKNASDTEIVAEASKHRLLMVVSNKRDFLPAIRAHVAKSTKKEFGCRRVCGLIVLVPNEEHIQERVLKNLEKRMMLDGNKITVRDVHERDLLVQIETSGEVKIRRLPRCPHCPYPDEVRRGSKSRRGK
jgi:hypothetical protein